MDTQNTWQGAGFLKEEVNIEDAMQRLGIYIGQMPDMFARFSGEELLYRRAAGKWSKQEILGHLIDSAINNLKRFTEIQFSPQPYKVISYQQSDLVKVNHYQELPLEHLLQLWKLLNQQIVYVVKNIPPGRLNYPVDPQYDNKEIKSLGWIICDYVAHMEHHLAQLK